MHALSKDAGYLPTFCRGLLMRLNTYAAVVMLAWCTVSPAQVVKSVPWNSDEHRYAVIEAATKPRAIMVMFIGGNGALNLQPGGTVVGPNVLIRMRDKIRDAEVRLIYVDAPVGAHSRSHEAYAKSVRRIIEQENKDALPVFVAGISRGTISAANVAARVPVAGVILLSVVTGSTYDGTVRGVPIADITAPSLLMLHRKDSCISSGSEHALRSFAAEMKKSSVTIAVLDGGTDEGPGVGRAAACHPKSYHGFNGIDAEVSDTILTWIDKVMGSR